MGFTLLIRSQGWVLESTRSRSTHLLQKPARAFSGGLAFGRLPTKENAMLRWLGVEANARAVTTLLLIGAAFGGIVVFAVDRLLPIADPAWNQDAFGEGYRRGQKELQLRIRIQQLELQEQRRRTSEEIDKQIRSMSDAEIDTLLSDEDFVD